MASDAAITPPSQRLLSLLHSRQKLVLGSSSPTRKRVLLRVLGSDKKFDVVKSSVDEKALGDRSKPRELVQLLARTKAHDVVSRLNEQVCFPSE